MHVSELEEFLDAYSRVSIAFVREKRSAFGRFFDEFAPIYERLVEQRRQTASRFNVFEALNLERRELVHSRFIAYLLDPCARHDQGARLLRAFLASLRVPVSPAVDLERTQAVCEFPLNGFGRLDIAVFLSDGSIIGIENKVDAGEQENQIARYQRWLSRHERLSAQPHVLIFLTPEGREPEFETWGINVLYRSYSELAAWLGSLDKLPSRLGTVVSMYTDICISIGRSHE